jgi:anti-anti-sigma factor
VTVTDSGPGRFVTFKIEGDVDVANAGAIGDELVELVERGEPAIVVLCSEVTFVESRGLAMMARVQRFATERGCDLTWRDLPLHVLRSVHVTGLDQYLRIEV